MQTVLALLSSLESLVKTFAEHPSGAALLIALAAMLCLAAIAVALAMKG